MLRVLSGAPRRRRLHMRVPSACPSARVQRTRATHTCSTRACRNRACVTGRVFAPLSWSPPAPRVYLLEYGGRAGFVDISNVCNDRGGQNWMSSSSPPSESLRGSWFAFQVVNGMVPGHRPLCLSSYFLNLFWMRPYWHFNPVFLENHLPLIWYSRDREDLLLMNIKEVIHSSVCSMNIYL